MVIFFFLFCFMFKWLVFFDCFSVLLNIFFLINLFVYMIDLKRKRKENIFKKK